MDASSATFTSTEYEAFNRLFDAIQCVLGTEESRIVDPLGRVEPLFFDEEDAAAFVRKLVTLGLMEFIFAGTDRGADRRRETYRVRQDLWLDAAGRVRRIPDPPFKTEERRIRDAIARHREQRHALVERRAALAREMADVDARIAAIDGKLEDAEQLWSEFAGLRDRVDRLCNGAA